MPHIVVEYSAPLANIFNLKSLLKELHQQLGSEDTVDPARIKTRAVKLDDYIVGDSDKDMVHITLKLMEDPVKRPPEFMKAVAANLQTIAKKHAPDAAVTAEVVLLDPDTYCL